MKKKYILGIVLIVVLIILITVFTINASAENNTTGNVKKIEDEKTIVRTTALLSRGSNEDDVVDIDTLTEQLNRYVGSGVTTVTEKSNDILIVTFLASGREYAININSGYIESTSPYLPSGFTYLAGTDLDTGLTIQDSLGNQYVWVEVPRTTEVYITSELGITEFTDEEYESIEEDLHTYTTAYRKGTTYADEYYSDAATGLTSSEYADLKKKMLKSVYENGGFYVGRYETGIANSFRTAAGTTTQTPVIKANAYPYNWVKCSQAQSLANGMESGEYTTSLMFGVQWDLILKYLETKGSTQSELNEDSTAWGNYKNNLYNITNTNSKYSTYYGYTWTNGAYGEKTSVTMVYLTTGASETFCKRNIYDLAGNIYEWTLETSYYSTVPCAVRGYSYGGNGNQGPASHRACDGTSSYDYIGFRVTLY